MVFTLTAPLGSLAWGVVSDAFGPRPTVLAAGFLMAVVTGALVTRRDRFRISRLDDPHDTGVPA
jgi:nitrate/nitrite transporter NarK